MKDSFGREINYLRISVTDRCNLRCFYCMPKEGVPLLAHDEILSFEEIVVIVNIAVELGIKKIRLTGGEPLTRRNIVDLVSMLSSISGIEDLAMTTNGILLAKEAKALVEAGLMRVNVSLDTIDAEQFRIITGGGNISDVFAGIDAALAFGLTPVKLNCVVDGIDQDSRFMQKNISAVKKYAEEKGLAVRFIQRMDFKRGIFSKVDGGEAGECRVCNRLRLLSNGDILPCLFSNKTYSTRALGVREALVAAIKNKPSNGEACFSKCMCSVGG